LEILHLPIDKFRKQSDERSDAGHSSFEKFVNTEKYVVQRWRVHKFGGSSVADAACMQRVADIVEREQTPRVGIVLSASRGVTDALLALITQAERQQPVDDAVLALRERHVEMARALIPGTSADAYTEVLDRDCQDITGILHAVHLTRSASSAVRDLVAGFGEIWSTRLFARYLAARGRRPGRVTWVDARDIVRVDWSALGPSVRWDESRANALQVIPGDVDATLVITGFIARTADGLQTTLGRNGSDFSASIFGDLLDAEEIVIWTDVDGVLSADPRRVPDARVIDSLSYHEAMELAYFGAKVIHPQTMAPAVEKRIPIWIKNTFAPDKAGSLICESPNSAHPVKGITSIDAVALVNVEGAGMIGVPGTAQRLFGALREDGISVILISQGSSEHSICFAIPHSEAERTARTVRHAFHAELNGGQIQNVDVIRGCSILSVVGDGMAGTPGIAAQVFGSLGASGVNVRAIAQGSSERNISVVIDERQTTRALRSVHAGFYLSPHTISVGAPDPPAARSPPAASRTSSNEDRSGARAPSGEASVCESARGNTTRSPTRTIATPFVSRPARRTRSRLGARAAASPGPSRPRLRAGPCPCPRPSRDPRPTRRTSPRRDPVPVGSVAPRPNRRTGHRPSSSRSRTDGDPPCGRRVVVPAREGSGRGFVRPGPSAPCASRSC